MKKNIEYGTTTLEHGDLFSPTAQINEYVAKGYTFFDIQAVAIDKRTSETDTQAKVKLSKTQATFLRSFKKTPDATTSGEYINIWFEVIEYESQYGKNLGFRYRGDKGERVPEQKTETKPKVSVNGNRPNLDSNHHCRIKERCMCLSYAKDLVIAGKIEYSNIFNESHKLLEYVLKGKKAE